MATLIAWGPGAGPAVGQARQGEPNFEMATQEGAFLSVAETFITAAAAGNRREPAGMLSPTNVGQTGAEAVERFLAGEVLPFFAPYKELARRRFCHAHRRCEGFASDKLRPFVIYVIEEGGTKVVANVLVDRLVEGRHCIKVPTGWRCPDFG
jgi:hypothetical protein